MTSAWYNEIDPFAAAWLRELIKAGHIAPGVVDERSIEDIRPDELVGYDQCHFFAGIGGWSHALRLAGWPDDRPVWTGSCPCQPFSEAGKGLGFADERHLWPAWFHLIQQCRPGIIFGEQVASPAALAWLDLVSTDLEESDYAVGAVDCCLAGVGAPILRQRLWWVASAESERCGEARADRGRPTELAANGGESYGMAGAVQPGWTQGRPGAGIKSTSGGSFSVSLACGAGQRLEGPGGSERSGVHETDAVGALRSAWSDAEWIPCRDGKWRPAQPGSFPLAHGIPARVGRLRGYGNAIGPEAAARFIQAYIECVTP